MALRSLLVAALLTASVAGQTGTPADSVYQAIRNDDSGTLKALARTAATLVDAQGQTPLMWASAYGSVTAMQTLLAAGADARAATPTGLTALHLAVTDVAKVRLLLDAGADLNAVSPLGRTPLLIAASATESTEVARLLLERKAKVNVVDTTGMTPLTAAAIAGNTELVELLLGRGAEVGTKGATPLGTALMGAAGSGDEQMVRTLLVKGSDVNAVSIESGGSVKNGAIQFGSVSALHFAVVSGNVAVVKQLLAAGASVDARDVRGMTPLMFAIATDRPNLQIVRALLEAKADITLKSKVDEDAVTWARKFQNPDVLAALKIPPARASTTVSREVAQRSGSATARAAVERSLPLLQTGSRRTMTDGGCVACHAQPLTGLATRLAQSRGWTVSPSDDLTQIETSFTAGGTGLLQLREGGGIPDGPVYSALLLAASGAAPSRGTDALVYYLAAKQRKDGRWRGVGATRAPIQDGDFSRTALAIRALRVYGIPAQSAATRMRIDRAANWLAAQTPISTQDRVMQLLGLHWAETGAGSMAPRTRELLALQNADGGWAQTRHLASDAYATGQVVYALRELGTPATDAHLMRAAGYLMRTQREDGSWYVTNRAMKIQPYFESGFPYGHDQWISQAGTAWAAIALTLMDREAPATARASR